MHHTPIRPNLTRLSLAIALALALSAPAALAADSQIDAHTDSQTAAQTEPAPWSLQHTFQQAQGYDPRLRKAHHVHQSEQEERSFALANLLPNIQSSASYSDEKSDNMYTDADSQYYDPKLPRSGGRLEDTSWRVSLQQPLFDYEAIEAYRGSKDFVNASGHHFERQRQELIFRVAEQYLNVLLATQKVHLSQQKVEALEKKRAQIQRAQELHISDRLSLLHATSQSDIARSDLQQNTIAVADAKNLLRNMTGTELELPADWHFDAYGRLPGLAEAELQQWVDAISHNRSVLAARSRVDQHRHNLSASRGGHMPTLSLRLSHYDRESDDEQRTRTDTVASVEVNFPLYTGGRAQAKVRKARADLQANQAELDYTLSTTRQVVELSFQHLRSYAQRLQILTEARVSALGYLEASERELSLNLSDQINVLDARTQLLDVELQYAEALKELLLADLRLRLETGQLDEQRLGYYDQQVFAIASNTAGE